MNFCISVVLFSFSLSGYYWIWASSFWMSNALVLVQRLVFFTVFCCCSLWTSFAARASWFEFVPRSARVPNISFAPAGLVLAHAPGNLWPVLRCWFLFSSWPSHEHSPAANRTEFWLTAVRFRLVFGSLLCFAILIFGCAPRMPLGFSHSHWRSWLPAADFDSCPWAAGSFPSRARRPRVFTGCHWFSQLRSALPFSTHEADLSLDRFYVGVLIFPLGARGK
jgi:hypothetical protein